jgi:hypothetical protein
MRLAPALLRRQHQLAPAQLPTHRRRGRPRPGQVRETNAGCIGERSIAALMVADRQPRPLDGARPDRAAT